jgi:hypothetical protein
MGDAPRLFQSMNAAEEAYRQQVQMNEQLGTKIDALTESINNLIVLLTARLPEPPPPPPNNSVNSSNNQQDQTPETPESNDNIQTNSRREFIERDRSNPPENDGTSSTAPADDASTTKPKILTGVKLPKFYGKYTEDVNAWISIIEDQFFIHQVAEKHRVASISPLLKDDALTWYLWLKSQYRRPITWKELKKELHVKYAESTVRTSALREMLKNLSYNGPKTIERYISKFRSLEQQISTKEMAFGDRLQYFLSPLEKDLRRFIKREHPNTMEIVYDAAIDWACINADSDGEKSQSDAKAGPSTLADPHNTNTSKASATSLLKLPMATAKQPSDDDFDMLQLNTVDMKQVCCFRCHNFGHFARQCKEFSARPIKKTKDQHRPHAHFSDHGRHSTRKASAKESLYHLSLLQGDSSDNEEYIRDVSSTETYSDHSSDYN